MTNNLFNVLVMFGAPLNCLTTWKDPVEVLKDLDLTIWQVQVEGGENYIFTRHKSGSAKNQKDPIIESVVCTYSVNQFTKQNQ